MLALAQLHVTVLDMEHPIIQLLSLWGYTIYILISFQEELVWPRNI